MFTLHWIDDEVHCFTSEVGKMSMWCIQIQYKNTYQNGSEARRASASSQIFDFLTTEQLLSSVYQLQLLNTTLKHW